MLEADVKKAVKEFCKQKGAWFFMPVPGGYSRRTVDFLICYRGKFIACETKRPPQGTVKHDMYINYPGPMQRKELYDVRQAGGYGILENSTDLETLRAVFTAIENAPV